MKIKQIAHEIEKIAPPRLALDWDNVGLLIGDANKNAKNILLTIDITNDVLAEAKRTKTELIISYHPVIWDGLKKITADGPEKIVYDLIRSNIAVYSIHTSLDIVPGGVNDGLAEMIGLSDTKPIGDYVDDPEQDNYKFVVFVPVDSVEKVANAIFAAGAGAIGTYSHCSFQTPGTGTFKPLEGSNPAIGKKGRLEKVEEIRLESVVPAAKLDSVIKVMKQSHPYEMPAFDGFKVHPTDGKAGLGRIGRLKKPAKLKDLISKIKKETHARAFGMIGKENRIIKTAAVCAGSCGKIINSVIAAKADLYLTGELKHHQALAAQEAGLTCICLSHTVSERFMLKKLAAQLQNQLKGVKISVSKIDKDPFTWKNF